MEPAIGQTRRNSNSKSGPLDPECSGRGLLVAHWLAVRNGFRCGKVMRIGDPGGMCLHLSGLNCGPIVIEPDGKENEREGADCENPGGIVWTLRTYYGLVTSTI